MEVGSVHLSIETPSAASPVSLWHPEMSKTWCQPLRITRQWSTLVNTDTASDHLSRGKVWTSGVQHCGGIGVGRGVWPRVGQSFAAEAPLKAGERFNEKE